MHLDLDDPISFTCLTATAADIKAEATFFITADFGFIGFCKTITNVVKNTCISCRITSRVRPMGLWSMSISFSIAHIRLVSYTFPGLFELRLIFVLKLFFKISFTNVDFPEPDTPVTAINFPRGKSTLNIFQVVLSCASQANGLSISCSTFCRRWNLPFS